MAIEDLYVEGATGNPLNAKQRERCKTGVWLHFLSRLRYRTFEFLSLRRSDEMARRRNEALWGFWREVVAEQASSGLTVAQFCREHELKAVTFYEWRRKLAGEDASVERRDEPLPTFVPVSMDRPPRRQRGFGLKLPNGIQVAVPSEFDSESFSRLLSIAGQTEVRHA